MEKVAIKTEFRTIGESGPAYEVIEKSSGTVKIKIILTGEVIENYPLTDYRNDPQA